MMKCSSCGKSNIAVGVISGMRTCIDCEYTWLKEDSVPFALRPMIEPYKAPDMNEVDVHPLINKDSRHYQMVDGVESIKLMEDMFTTEELMAWSKITSYKYRFRISSKEHNGSIEDGIKSDAKKILSYEAYYRYLESKL